MLATDAQTAERRLIMGNNEFMLLLQDAVRTALNEVTNEEIEKLRDQFENEMAKAKRNIVGKLVNQIQMSASHDRLDNRYVIQFVINGG